MGSQTGPQGLGIFKVVKTYAGEMAGEVEQLPIQFPASFVAYSGSKYEWVDTKTWLETASFTVLVCAKNLRTALDVNEAVRTDPNTGAYVLLNNVLPALAYKDFGLAMQELKPVDVRLLVITKTTAIYGIEFQAAFDRDYV
ncbi:MAG: DUF1834 family protein [Actinomycetota bacterium]|nr:DUF1834 family protein [Actinomycetota bacterium]